MKSSSTLEIKSISNTTPHKKHSHLLNLLKKNSKNKHRNFNSKYVNKEFRFQEIKTTFHDLSKSYNLSYSTFYLAISILDSVSSRYAFDKKNFRKIALTSLCLASKVRESFMLSLNFASIKSRFQGSFKEFNKLEKTVLICLDFDLNFVTGFDLVSEFLKHKESVEGIDDNNQEIFGDLIFKLLYSLMLHYDTNKFNTLPIALSVLMIARKIMGCRVLLPEFFKKITGYSGKKVRVCYKFICYILKIQCK